MLVAFLLGLLGSFGHCVGMCSGITLLLTRRGLVTDKWTLFLAQAGRLTTYACLGFVLGSLQYGFSAALGLKTLNTQGNAEAHNPLAFPVEIRPLQGALAMFAAIAAIYLALAFLGRAPSPEIMLTRLTSRWGQTMRRFSTSGEKKSSFRVYAIGMLWGFLPCGLVLTALLTALVAANPVQSALTMMLFGLGTLPAMMGVGWLARKGGSAASQLARHAVFRQAAALAIMVFGTQMALRGLAAWGWVNHMRIGGVMLW